MHWGKKKYINKREPKLLAYIIYSSLGFWCENQVKTLSIGEIYIKNKHYFILWVVLSKESENHSIIFYESVRIHHSTNYFSSNLVESECENAKNPTNITKTEMAERKTGVSFVDD